MATGKGSEKLGKVVDLYPQASPVAVEGSGQAARKSQRIRSTVPNVKSVLEAAFVQYPRIGYIAGDKKNEVVLRTWGTSGEGQILFHNQLMYAARMSLKELSKIRAAFHLGSSEGAAQTNIGGTNNAASEVLQVVARPMLGAVDTVPAAATPPGGRALAISGAQARLNGDGQIEAATPIIDPASAEDPDLQWGLVGPGSL